MPYVGSAVDRESGYGSDFDVANRLKSESKSKCVNIKSENSHDVTRPKLFNSSSFKSVLRTFESAASFASGVFNQVTMASSSDSNAHQTDGNQISSSNKSSNAAVTSGTESSSLENDFIYLSFDENHFDPFAASKLTVKSTQEVAVAQELKVATAEQFQDESINMHFDSEPADLSLGSSNLSETNSSKKSETSRLLTEFGLTDDHFGKPDAAFLGLSSAEELEVAAANCKQRVVRLEQELAALQVEIDDNTLSQSLQEQTESKRRNLIETKANLVRLLVSLRLRLHEMNSPAEIVSPNASDSSVTSQNVLGHQFVATKINDVLALIGFENDSSPQSANNSARLRCDCCAKPIWTLVQDWFICTQCTYRAHSRCINLISRRCVTSRVDALLNGDSPASGMELAVRPERGLLGQKFRCAECYASLLPDTSLQSQAASQTHLSKGMKLMVSTEGRNRSRSDNMVTSSSFLNGIAAGLRDEANDSVEDADAAVKQCDYNGLYYCATCHWNDMSVIPARVLHSWDFQQRPVCRASKQFLSLVQSKAVFDLAQLNPRLLQLIPALNRVHKLRETILKMKQYFLHCRYALSSGILLLLSHRQHFVESATIFSLQDLIDVHQGTLELELREVFDRFANHISHDCPLCQAKAFICEICGNDSDPLFLFDDAEMKISTCNVCLTVYHKRCFEQVGRSCRKCDRFNRRRKQIQ